MDEAEDEVEKLERFAKKLEPEFQEELDELIRKNLLNTCNVLLAEYKKKLASLAKEIDLNGLTGISIDPLKLMGGSVTTADDFSVKQFIHSKEVEDGKEWVENTDKKWYKPWTWFQEKGHYRTKYKTVKYVKASELAQEFLTPMQETVYNNGENAHTYAVKQSNRIAKLFAEQFKKLDGVLKEKLSLLENYATDKDKAEERIKESECKIKWLEEIKSEVESILEI